MTIRTVLTLEDATFGPRQIADDQLLLVRAKDAMQAINCGPKVGEVSGNGFVVSSVSANCVVGDYSNWLLTVKFLPRLLSAEQRAEPK